VTHVVLALDPGTEGFGWATGSANTKPRYGTYVPFKTRDDLGTFLIDARTTLFNLVKTYSVTEIVYESPVVNRMNNVYTLRKMFALHGMIEVECHDAGLPVFEAAPGTVRKHFLGKGMTPRKSKEIKEAVMARCSQLGWKVRTDHEADALAILDYTLAIRGSRLLNGGLL
jgi:Holliday junction resolvasome RuvABC endonuclease subunit